MLPLCQSTTILPTYCISLIPTYNIFSSIALLVPPSCEEGHLNVNERTRLVNL